EQATPAKAEGIVPGVVGDLPDPLHVGYDLAHAPLDLGERVHLGPLQARFTRFRGPAIRLARVGSDADREQEAEGDWVRVVHFRLLLEVAVEAKTEGRHIT